MLVSGRMTIDYIHGDLANIQVAARMPRMGGHVTLVDRPPMVQAVARHPHGEVKLGMLGLDIG